MHSQTVHIKGNIKKEEERKTLMQHKMENKNSINFKVVEKNTIDTF